MEPFREAQNRVTVTATAAPRGPKARTSTATSAIWRHFQDRFGQTYGQPCPFEGSGTPYPARTRFAGTWLPTSAANQAAVAELVATRLSLVEIRTRIDRMFSHPAHVADGISLPRVAFWIEQLESFEALNKATRVVYGRRTA